MACLSWQREGVKGFTMVANSMYLLSQSADRIEFEILAADAGTLIEHVGELNRFYLGDEIGVFQGKIGPMTPALSVSPGLALLRHEPTLRGYLEIIDREPVVA